MYNVYNPKAKPYYINMPTYNTGNIYSAYKIYPWPYCNNISINTLDFSQSFSYNNIPNTEDIEDGLIRFKDYGPEPFVVNITEATIQNNNYRIALWTGNHLQVTLMSIDVGDDIGLEVHPNLDQFIRIEEGQGLVKMGERKDMLDFQEKVYDDFAFVIPAGKWHNLINTGNIPLKLYSIYAPPQHPHGTIHETKTIAKADEHNHAH